MQFSNVLIANRGEVAARIMRACTKLGLRSVAVYSDADADAYHVRLADTAMHIGRAEARASYLDGPRVIAAAQAAGADAVHPGYGFLAENADFAQQCCDAGLVFVGPSPPVIRAMGAKITAKQLAERAGVRCVSGYHGSDQSDATLTAEAARIGVPLLIKASAGGGGRGMRQVDSLERFSQLVSLARNEADAAFGDPALLLERLVSAPRHIEVQILADKHGNVVHLFERDCSVQRNYQKVIEEAPAPNLDPALRAEILASAVRVANEIAYDNVGTVEFVVDATRGEAYFLEMNTRLQVEHPVTEMITGVDLVEWQLRVAGGERLGLRQEAIDCTGWAIEARVAAEDPAHAYRPEIGRIQFYREPDMLGVRIDSGIAAGSEITPYYDSMFAKLVAHGSDRGVAIGRLRRALSRYHISGVGVNIGFLGDVLASDEFQRGTHLTNCLSRAFPDGWQSSPVTPAELGLAVLSRHTQLECLTEARSPWSSLGAWRLGERSGRDGASVYYVRYDGQEPVLVAVRGRAGSYRIESDGQQFLKLEQVRRDADRMVYELHGHRHYLDVHANAERITLFLTRGPSAFEVLRCEQVLLEEQTIPTATGDTVVAPTPGLVTEVLVKVGEAVAAGQPVVVMEAMKLLQQLCAPVTGNVQNVHYRAGDTVSSGDCLLTIETVD